MEKWDLYNKNREKIGKIIERGQELQEDEYHLSVHIWIVNSEGKYLIQKRSSTKKKYPNMWSTTGGAAICGETSEQACIRETSEELGIELKPEDIKMLGTMKRKNVITDVWMTHKDIDIDKLVLQEEEVTAAKWADIKEIKTLLEEEKFTYTVIEGLEMYIKLQ